MSQFLATAPLTMSSRDIAEMTGKRHDHVMRDIREMLEALKIDAPRFGGTYKDARNREKPEYHLPKDLTLTLVTGYKVEWRKKVIDRWMELEQQAAQPASSVPKAELDKGLGMIEHLGEVLVVANKIFREFHRTYRLAGMEKRQAAFLADERVYQISGIHILPDAPSEETKRS